MSLDSILRSTGKNLWRTYWFKTAHTSAGITYQYLPDEDCYLLNGTSTTSISMGDFTFWLDNVLNKSITLSAYYVSGEINIPTSGYAVAYVGKASNSSDTTINFLDTTIKQTSSKTKVCDKEGLKRIWFAFSSGVTATNLKVKVQLEISDTATTYEPYQQGPKKINVTKNLIPVESNITWSGVKTLNVNIPAGTYTISWSSYSQEALEGGTISDSPVIRLNNRGTSIYLNKYTQKQLTLKLTTTETIIYLYTNGYSATNSVNVQATINNLMMEQGNTSSAYIPHNAEAKKVTYGSKNLIPFYNRHGTSTNNGITYTIDDSIITANGTVTDAQSQYFLFRNQDITQGVLNVTPTETFYMSGCPEGGSTSTYYLEAQLYKDTTYATSAIDVGNGILIHRPDKDYNRIVFKIYITKDTTVNNLVFRPQLEFGTKATEYVKYNREVVWQSADSTSTVVSDEEVISDEEII